MSMSTAGHPVLVGWEAPQKWEPPYWRCWAECRTCRWTVVLTVTSLLATRDDTAERIERDALDRLHDGTET